MSGTVPPKDAPITAKVVERAMARGRWSVVSVLNTPDCEPTGNSATLYFKSEDEGLAYLSGVGGYDAQTTPSEWKRARERVSENGAERLSYLTDEAIVAALKAYDREYAQAVHVGLKYTECARLAMRAAIEAATRG